MFYKMLATQYLLSGFAKLFNYGNCRKILGIHSWQKEGSLGGGGIESIDERGCAIFTQNLTFCV